MSSPVIRAPVSALSPVLRRSLTVASPPPARVTLCKGPSTRDELEYVEMATDTGIVSVDKPVQAVVEYCDVGTDHDLLGVTSSVLPPADSVESVVDPPVETPPAASPPVSDALELADAVVTPPARLSAGSTGSSSPIGASLVDSHDEVIATRLPGYLINLKPCEVSDQKFFIFLSLFVSYISFYLPLQFSFLVFHPFPLF